MTSENPQSPQQPQPPVYAPVTPPQSQPPLQQQYGQQMPFQPAPTKPIGLAITALIIGAVAFLLGLVPVVGIVLGLAGVAFGIIALVKKQSKGLAVTGLALAACGFLASVAITAGVASIFAQIEQSTSELSSVAPLDQGTTDGGFSDESSTEPDAAETDANVPAEHASALKKADSYANMMYMSKAGLYDQLTSEYGEKFSPEAAQYAVDNIDADWNANALEKARSYQDSMAMSPEAIREQLVSEYGEQFTEEEADYAIAHLNK
ncbi:MAG: Ltp family lipoprotein [Leucobacter sp.]